MFVLGGAEIFLTTSEKEKNRVKLAFYHPEHIKKEFEKSPSCWEKRNFEFLALLTLISSSESIQKILGKFIYKNLKNKS